MCYRMVFSVYILYIDKLYIADDDCWEVLFVDVSCIAKRYFKLPKNTKGGVIQNTPNNCMRLGL